MASTSGTGEPPIVLYHYPFSPVARRVVWYLTLRGIPYKECLQPGILPRPDVTALGVNYRRIPILSIGRNVYLDSRLIIQKLEVLHPEKPRLGAATGGDRAIEHLLRTYNFDGGHFSHAFQLLPGGLPLFKDQTFLKDRSEFMGGKLTSESMDRARPEAINEMKSTFELLEHGLLADGREWVLGTDGPRVADIEAIWPIHWVSEIPGALPTDVFSASTFPRVNAWIERFKRAVSEARQQSPGSREKVSGEDALKLITASGWNETTGSVDKDDSMVIAEGLQGGDLVTVWPTDTGSSHKDTGSLVGVSSTEMVIETRAKDAAATALRVHVPRHGFRAKKATEGTEARL